MPIIGQEEAEPQIPLYVADAQKLAADLMTVSRNKMADVITGGLASPGKMPCHSIGLPASRCNVGSRLATIEGSVCHPDVCYAKQRNYKRQNVQDKLEQRYQGLFNPLWTPAMIFLVNYYCDQYFRLFDSGDLQGINHLKNIVTLARNVPDVKIWMPTREVGTVHRVREEIGDFPENLTVRVSSPLVDGQPLKGFTHTSTVVSDSADATCIAQRQKNKCDGELGKCRDCWEKPGNVSYPLH